MISGKILYILRLEHSAECSKRIFHRMGLPQDGAACLPPQALTRQIPLFVTCGDIFPRSGGSLSSRGRLCLVGKLSGIAISRPLGEGGLTRSGKTEGVSPRASPLKKESRKVCGLSGSLFSQERSHRKRHWTAAAPSCEKVVQKRPQAFLNHKYKTILPLNMARANAVAIQNRSLSAWQQLTCGRAGWETGAYRSAGTARRPADP